MNARAPAVDLDQVPDGRLSVAVAIALADLAVFSERRTFRLVSPSLNGELPAFLSPAAGRSSGLMIAQYTAAALVVELRALAHPVSVDTIATSDSQEDHVSMGMTAATMAGDAVSRLRQVLSIELLCASRRSSSRMAPPRRRATSQSSMRSSTASRLWISAARPPLVSPVAETLSPITERDRTLGRMSTFTQGAPARRWPDALRFGLADLLGLVAIASVLVVVWMWMRNGGIQTGVSSVEGALSSFGLITGLLSSVLMILMVLAIARIPLVERAWGHDLLTHRHRTLGYWSFWLMVAHVVLFAIERAWDAGWTGLYDVFIRNPWYLFATVGTAMLIGVVVTSIRWARNRLRYESWHLLHLYSYLGMGLALPHQIFDGVHFHELWTRAYWWGIYLFALAAIVVFRVGVPAWRSLYHRVRVIGVTREADDVFSVTVEGHRLDRLRTRSGQFFIWRFRDGPGWSRGNPYTISAAPTSDRLRVTIQAVGDGTARVERLNAGTKVAIEGPYGTMTAERRRHRRMLVMAAGVGITPMRALIEDTPFAHGDATLIYRYRRDPIFRGELEEIAERRGVELHLLPGSRARENSWVAQGDDLEELRRLVPDVAECDVYLCGPVAWIAAVRRAVKAAGVSRRQIHTEDFAW